MNGEKRSGGRHTTAETVGLVVGALVIAPGALMIAEGIISYIAGTTILFAGVNAGFEFLVGLSAVVLAASPSDGEKTPMPLVLRE